MHHYRAVVLVLASNNNEIFRNCRKVWKKYMNVDASIKVYFVYGELGVPLFEYDASSDLVFNDVKEDNLNIEKTIKAMEYIDSHVEYDFFIRTNLSTFWDFYKLHLQLNDLPKEKCYSGDGPLYTRYPDGYYLRGVDIIVTPDMIKSIISNKQLVNYLECDDCAMGRYFHGHLKAPMLPNRICFFEDITGENDVEIIMSRIRQSSLVNNVNHYRVKSRIDRERIDFYIYKILLKTIYNIDY
jgi:hypothetical protein